MIHICYGLHDGNGKYSKFVGASMASVFEKTFSPVVVHILHDNTLIADNRDKFIYMTGQYGQHVEFHNVEKICVTEIDLLRAKLAEKINSRFSIGAFYRLLAKKILSAQGIRRVIYLDADIIVNLDILELWQQDLRNFPLAAVAEIDATNNLMINKKFLLDIGLVEEKKYFCSGVMVLNLDKFSEKFFYAGVKFLIECPACESVDQDILNAFYSENYLRLPQEFNSFVRTEKNPPDKKIYHYAGNVIGMDLDDPYDRLFLENFARTPWFNVNILDGIGREIHRISDAFIMRMQWLMKISDKRRAFFVSAENFAAVQTIFNLRGDDIFIDSKRTGDELIPVNFNELIDKITVERGRTIFFIFDLNYGYLGNELIKLGFKPHQDFENGLMFLTYKQSRQKPSDYNFIRAM